MARRTGKQRAASRRNLVKARRAKSQDSLFGYAGRLAISTVSSTLSGGTAKPINDFIEGKGTPGQQRKARSARKQRKQARQLRKMVR